MYNFTFAAAVVVFLVLAALNLALGLVRSGRNQLGLISMAVVELTALLSLVVAVVVVNGGGAAKTSTVEYFFYAVCALLVPLAGITFTLIERNRFVFYVYALACFTLFVMQIRMHQIWFGA